MVDTIIDRGGDVGADSVPLDRQNGSAAQSGGWGNIAFLGAGAGLIGAMCGIAIGYSAFHHSGSTKAAEQPAKASERAVDDALGSPTAQRAALAKELGEPGASQTDIFGRPLVADSSRPSAGSGALAAPSNDEAPLEPRRTDQARTMADAARRSPIMAFGSNGFASSPSVDASASSAQQDSRARVKESSSAGADNLGASGFGPSSAGGADKATGRGTTDFTDQLGHAAIESVRASLVADRNLLLSAGTVIPCTLQTAINSTQAGFVSCVINHDVYSDNGRIVLLDKGTKVLGQYSGGITQGQARLFVLWTRALTPRGVAIDLGSPSADSLGRAGLTGGVDTQFWSRFGVALMLSVLEDASNIASKAVAAQGSYTTQVPGNVAGTVLQNTLSIRPILKKNQGDTAAIFVAKDFDFRSVYDIRLRR